MRVARCLLLNKTLVYSNQIILPLYHIMDCIVVQEWEAAGAADDDVLLWFQRHGPSPHPGTDFQHLYGAITLMGYAMQRAASEIWKELDHARYVREKAKREAEISTPYGVLRRMFWGRFRRYWNPTRQSGEVWQLHNEQQQATREQKKATYREDRPRGAQKRRTKEQQQMDRKAESRTTGVDRASRHFLAFLEWRQSTEGKSFNNPPGYIEPEGVFYGSAPPTKMQTVGVLDASSIHRLLCQLIEQNEIVNRVVIKIRQTLDVSTVPAPYLIHPNDTLFPLTGMARLKDDGFYSVTHHHKGCLGIGEYSTAYRLFPDPWNAYEGLEEPLGNPGKYQVATVVRNLKGCIAMAKIFTPEVQLTVHTGGSMTVQAILDKYFVCPFEMARREALDTQRTRATKHRLRSPLIVGN